MNGKKIILPYLIGTFSLTYIMWGTIILANQYGCFKYGTPFYYIFYAIGGLSPTIFGYIISKKEKTIKGIVPFAKEAFSAKQSLKYYVLILAFFAIYFGFPALIGEVGNGLTWYLCVPLIVIMIFFGGLEEVGWRYTLQSALEKRFSFVASTIITACVWGLWHLPLFFIEGMSKGMNFGLFFISVLGMAFALAASFRVSKSIWLCVLFHAMINAFSQTWIRSGDLSGVCISTVAMVALSLFVVSVNKHTKTEQA